MIAPDIQAAQADSLRFLKPTPKIQAVPEAAVCFRPVQDEQGLR